MQPAIDRVSQAEGLCSLVYATWMVVRIVGALVIQQELARRAALRTHWPMCPRCGARLESRGRVRREIRTLLGMVVWYRKVGRCPRRCAIGQVAPLDNALGLAPRQKTCVSVKTPACLLAVFVPYRVAARILEALTGGPVSGDAIWQWVQEAGCRAKEQEQRGQGGVEEEERDPDVDRLPLIVGADGVNAAFRPTPGTAKGKTIWKEIKVGVLARLGQRTGKGGGRGTLLRHRRVVAVRGEVEEFEPRLWGEALRQGLGSARNVAWLSDGAVWLWNLVQRFRDRCPQIVPILDFYHATQNLWKGVEKCFEGQAEAAQRYFEDARHELRHGDPDKVIEGLQAALTLPGLSDEANRLLGNAHEYLSEHRDHMDYAIFKKLGIPIGSGFVESACKWMVQQRFKCVGMRWSEQGFDNLLYLRAAWVNGRFEQLFDGPGERLPCAA